MSLIDIVASSLKYDEAMLQRIMRMGHKKSNRTLTMKVVNGSRYYYIRKRGESRMQYVPKDKHREVNKIRRERFAAEAKELLVRNIELQKQFIEKYQPTDFASINAKLPKAYRYYEDEDTPLQRRDVVQSENPYKREELKHRTTFGLMVRTRVECMISEVLESAGLEFYYEKALRIIDENGRPKVIYPDFTIVLTNGDIIYWEHKGMYADEKYFERDQRKMWLYYKNGIYEPKNLIVTMDGPDGSIDIESVKRIIWILEARQQEPKQE